MPVDRRPYNVIGQMLKALPPIVKISKSMLSWQCYTASQRMSLIFLFSNIFFKIWSVLLRCDHGVSTKSSGCDLRINCLHIVSDVTISHRAAFLERIGHPRGRLLPIDSPLVWLSHWPCILLCISFKCP